MRVLVTSGATVPFDLLIQSSLDPMVIRTLVDLGFSDLDIQYGHGQEVFQKSLQSLDQEHLRSINITGFAFTEDLQERMRESQLIISHGGTGSILDALRSLKPLVIVINPSLMDNHQAQVAGKFTSQGYAIQCGPEPQQLCKAIRQCVDSKLHSMPPANSLKVAEIIRQEASR